MAMNPTVLTEAIVARLYLTWRNPAPINKRFDRDYWLREFARIISEEVIQHIQGFARCNGTDSGADSHDFVGIV